MKSIPTIHFMSHYVASQCVAPVLGRSELQFRRALCDAIGVTGSSCRLAFAACGGVVVRRRYQVVLFQCQRKRVFPLLHPSKQ
ncbi:hypothetical protein NDU88_006592 [Pleurodeles waltl]|uniref:Uncharacterized protein n=1 Tax=Pleurodeles waltl TaxID=8319 RepID=A0AAV7N1A2_PLEWA|nr:hypothetical protein NDU88_006592 [Pleurodeles waltl]